MNFGCHILHAYIMFGMGSDVYKLMLSCQFSKRGAEAALSCFTGEWLYIGGKHVSKHILVILMFSFPMIQN